VAVLHQWLGLSFPTTLLAANVLPVAWLAAFTWLQGHSSTSSSSGWGRHTYQEVPLDEAGAEQALQGAGWLWQLAVAVSKACGTCMARPLCRCGLATAVWYDVKFCRHIRRCAATLSVMSGACLISNTPQLLALWLSCCCCLQVGGCQLRAPPASWPSHQPPGHRPLLTRQLNQPSRYNSCQQLSHTQQLQPQPPEALPVAYTATCPPPAAAAAGHLLCR
jgi:hypothetical protein